MIFLINGKARSGKDTIADYIVKKTGAKKVWFSKPLKDMAMKYFGLTYDECYDHKTEFSRRILQAIGQMYRDEFGKNFWVDKVISNILDMNTSNKDKHFVISDCRYKNEIIELCSTFDQKSLVNIIQNIGEEIWKEYQIEYYGAFNKVSDFVFINNSQVGCTTVKITRDNCPKIEYGADHPSENDLNNFSFDNLIENNGTLQDLYKIVDNLIENTIGIEG